MATPSLPEAMPWLHQQTTRTLLEHLAAMDHKSAEKYGLQPQFIDGIQRMKFGEFNDFVDHFAKHLSINVNFDEMQSVFTQKCAEMQLMREVLKLGASHTQMQAWFGVTSDKIRKLKTRYLGTKTPGECCNIPLEQQALAKQTYNGFALEFKNNRYADALSLLATARKTGYTIAQISKLLFRRRHGEKRDELQRLWREGKR